MTAEQTSNAGVARPSRHLRGLGLAAVFALTCIGAACWLYGRRDEKADGPPGVAEQHSPPGTVPPPWFADVTAVSGLDFTYRNGEEAGHFTLLESLGGGVALLDYNGDGLLDIFVTGGGWFGGDDGKQILGYPCKLYKNLGAWKFQDVTEEAGLAMPWPYTHGAAVADFDRDGWPDLLVTGYGRLTLLHNEADRHGKRRFVDVTEKMGLRDLSWSTSAGWGDLDGDGWPDLYVCHYVDWSFAKNPLCAGRRAGVPRDICSPVAFAPLKHALFHNEHGRKFRDVSAEHGLHAAGNGLGVVLADLNDDGRPDIYVANDTNANFLYLNRGQGKLEEQATISGVAAGEHGRPDGSMGVDVGDFDGSGRPSLWVTTFQGEVQALYRNLGRELFRHHSRAAGIAAVGSTFVGFGTGFVDVDNDGWQDLVIANGHVFHDPPGNERKQRPLLLHNEEYQGRRFFNDGNVQGGTFFQTPALGRGLAIGDLDNDGWPDLVVSHLGGPVTLLRNDAARTAPANWLGVKLVGKEQRDVVGSTVIVECDGRKLTRFVKGGGSYLSASDARLLFGLAASKSVQRITVKWSWGQTQSWTVLASNAYWELIEGEGKARRAGAAGD
jgi:hypothetical protein